MLKQLSTPRFCFLYDIFNKCDAAIFINLSITTMVFLFPYNNNNYYYYYFFLIITIRDINYTPRNYGRSMDIRIRIENFRLSYCANKKNSAFNLWFLYIYAFRISWSSTVFKIEMTINLLNALDCFSVMQYLFSIPLYFTRHYFDENKFFF